MEVSNPMKRGPTPPKAKTVHNKMIALRDKDLPLGLAFKLSKKQVYGFHPTKKR